MTNLTRIAALPASGSGFAAAMRAEPVEPPKLTQINALIEAKLDQMERGFASMQRTRMQRARAAIDKAETLLLDVPSSPQAPPPKLYGKKPIAIVVDEIASFEGKPVAKLSPPAPLVSMWQRGPDRVHLQS
jgi:hypothetical protein